MFGFFGTVILVAVLINSAVWAANPFALGKVDYFNEASLQKAMVRQEEKSLDWREPIIGADGKVTYYQPPSPVLALLDNPTEENAQAYLEWQDAKTIRMQKAQEVLERVLEKKE